MLSDFVRAQLIKTQWYYQVLKQNDDVQWKRNIINLTKTKSRRVEINAKMNKITKILKTRKLNKLELKCRETITIEENRQNKKYNSQQSCDQKTSAE